MNQHLDYEFRIDKIFGIELYKHRTLRTLFDPYSTEWGKTTMDEKLKILKRIVDGGEELNILIEDYKDRYIEQNQNHIVKVAEEAICNLLAASLKNKTE